MARPIHEKIDRLLSERGRKKKELAEALGISPQTMTDIVKGRSSVTLSHLKGLVKFFHLKADYWIDDTREDPATADMVADANANMDASLAKGALRSGDLQGSGILRIADRKGFLTKLRAFILSHRDVWERMNGSLDSQERELLGIDEGRPNQNPEVPDSKAGSGGHQALASTD
jgi:transcriptional regulator with XRE-family HTH domain